jgi:Uri superfamily endonuclease
LRTKTQILNNIPSDKGTYIIILSVKRGGHIRIGRLGIFEIAEGYYAYVGSAHGSGGMKARIRYHIQRVDKPRWHIDYFKQLAVPIEVWFTTAGLRLEKNWAEIMNNWSWFNKTIAGFGSSDYHRGHVTHLFYTKREPSFDAFEKIIWTTTRGNIDVQRVFL